MGLFTSSKPKLKERKLAPSSVDKAYRKLEKARYKSRIQEEAKNRFESKQQAIATAQYKSKPSFVRAGMFLERGVTRAIGLPASGKRKASGLIGIRRAGIVYGTEINRPLAKRSVPGQRTGRKGRPTGTLDPRYTRYGGVYGYRRYMAAELAIAKAQARQRAVISPEQQQVIDSVEARQRAAALDPENRTIPDTAGVVPLRSLQDEIDEATHLVD